MCRDIAAIAEKKEVFILGVAAYRTGLEVGRILVYILDHHRWVDICNLDSVLHAVGRKDGA
jgi:hypothetical protein